MFNHAPNGYVCPFCLLAQGKEDDRVLSRPSDIVARGGGTMAIIAAHWWQKNPGHVLVLPLAHYENLYDVPDDIGAEIFSLSRRVAIAMKHAYSCDGVSTRQHNEPAGYQDVWHFHVRVFPRYRDDRLYLSSPEKHPTTVEQRLPYARKLRSALGDPA